MMMVASELSLFRILRRRVVVACLCSLLGGSLLLLAAPNVVNKRPNLGLRPSLLLFPSGPFVDGPSCELLFSMFQTIYDQYKLVNHWTKFGPVVTAVAASRLNTGYRVFQNDVPQHPSP